MMGNYFGNMMGWGYGPGSGLFGGFLGLIFMVVFWGLVIWAAVSLFRGSWGGGGCCGGQHRQGGNDESALEILKKRYAKGEITKEEFEKMKNDLQ